VRIKHKSMVVRFSVFTLGCCDNHHATSLPHAPTRSPFSKSQVFHTASLRTTRRITRAYVWQANTAVNIRYHDSPFRLPIVYRAPLNTAPDPHRNGDRIAHSHGLPQWPRTNAITVYDPTDAATRLPAVGARAEPWVFCGCANDAEHRYWR
jgi:hypothetical protein